MLAATKQAISIQLAATTVGHFVRDLDVNDLANGYLAGPAFSNLYLTNRTTKGEKINELLYERINLIIN